MLGTTLRESIESVIRNDMDASRSNTVRDRLHAVVTDPVGNPATHPLVNPWSTRTTYTPENQEG